ncbi:SDR family NAD(P)-dependent oxidoreductase [Mycolicibacterium sp. YH-1]|uniref:SDR family NAD(P)-dependent oxidoreductase n=1 Tax=Mycolicibacterium sp. YH-1 TaxID=2908837 RepID=UPI001F4C0446|nr:SDR family oxidoreductase [Mycolicibacterium sp. YH-1]UNB52573.1 SDR family oxidoreductase [Mycolicibacterium sp. YH-1]
MALPVTIITGASSGIGAATAQLLAQRGHAVALLARSEVALREVAAGLPDGTKFLVQPCDVTSPEQVTDAVGAVVDELGTPFGLINAAGVCVPGALPQTTADNWHTTLGVNLTGTFLMCQAVVAAMCASGEVGSIVNLGSEAASIGMPHYSAYCASKAGVLGLTRALAAELAPRVRVNALCPGPVDTPMLHSELALAPDLDRAYEAEVGRVPLRAIATAAEVADAAVWLLHAGTATGTALALDGGTTAACYGSAPHQH